MSKSTGDGGYVSKTTGDGGYASKTSGGSGAIKINLSGVTNSAGYTNVSGGGSAKTSVYGQDGSGFSYRGSGSPLNGTTGAPTTSVDDFGGHTHTVFFSHGHAVSVDCGDHTHGLTLKGSASADDHKHTFEIPDHKHSFTVPNHQHTFEVPNHTHEIKLDNHRHDVILQDHTHDFEIKEHSHEAIYGIYETNYVPKCEIWINNSSGRTKIANLYDKQEKTYTIKITASQFQAFDTGVNEIEIVSIENINPVGNKNEEKVGGLCRASFTMFWGGYYQYE